MRGGALSCMGRGLEVPGAGRGGAGRGGEGLAGHNLERREPAGLGLGMQFAGVSLVSPGLEASGGRCR